LWFRGAIYAVIAFAKSFSWSLISTNPPYPPLIKVGNYNELLVKSSFEKGDLRNLQAERIYGKRYRRLGAVSNRKHRIFLACLALPPDWLLP
jgi:hypothetical protein